MSFFSVYTVFFISSDHVQLSSYELSVALRQIEPKLPGGYIFIHIFNPVYLLIPLLAIAADITALHSCGPSNRALKLDACGQTLLVADIRGNAPSDQTGRCFLGYVNVGYSDDLCLKPWINCPLGEKTLKLALIILFAACVEFV